MKVLDWLNNYADLYDKRTCVLKLSYISFVHVDIYQNKQ